MRYAIVKTPMLALGNGLWYIWVSLPQEIQELSIIIMIMTIIITIIIIIIIIIIIKTSLNHI